MYGLVRDYYKSFPRILGFKIRELHIETIRPLCVYYIYEGFWDIPPNCSLFMTDWH